MHCLLPALKLWPASFAYVRFNLNTIILCSFFSSMASTSTRGHPGLGKYPIHSSRPRPTVKRSPKLPHNIAYVAGGQHPRQTSPFSSHVMRSLDPSFYQYACPNGSLTFFSPDSPVGQNLVPGTVKMTNPLPTSAKRGGIPAATVGTPGKTSGMHVVCVFKA